MRTLLIDSIQIESGESMNDDFKKAATSEIQLFKDEMRARFPDRDVSKITDGPPREVMNTVGKKDRLGIKLVCCFGFCSRKVGIRIFTHILGKAFGTQLLCEQVVGRGLRYSYDREQAHTWSLCAGIC